MWAMSIYHIVVHGHGIINGTPGFVNGAIWRYKWRYPAL